MSDDQKPPLTFEDVQEILRLLEQSSFDELQLDIGSLRLRLRRGGAGQSPVPVWESAPKAQQSTLLPATLKPLEPSSSLPTQASGLVEVRAPMLGTFYRAPRPGDAPFVDVGTKVDTHMTVGIIEVMKLMNAVAAGVEGEIREICVRNGELVEFDQVLMRVSPP
jgi:acetyl-CoA carboxylase biotin carboxyl carrier protein